MVKPPSDKISVPTIKAESSDAKNTAAFPISDGSPCLPTGVMSIQSCFTCCKCSSGTSFPKTGVSIEPGESVLTRIFAKANLMTNLWLKI